MSLYFTNVGEQEMMRAILNTLEWNLGLYKNVVTPDGSLTMLGIQEMPSGGGRGYATKTLNLDFALAAAANKWYVSQNAAGKAEGLYHNTYLEFEFNTVDVADGNTVYGAVIYTYVVPFDGGATEIKPGNIIKGATSAATGIVTGVIVTSGAWDGTAAGLVFIKTKAGTFQDGENLIISGKVATIAVNAGGTGYNIGDIVSITQTGGSGTKVVVTVAGGGIVSGVVLVEGGQGHSVTTGLATANIVGTGTGLLLNISTLSTTAVAVSNTQTMYGGDAHKQLLALEELPEAKLIDTVGQKIRVITKWSASTA
jgi:hypothetical protein